MNMRFKRQLMLLLFALFGMGYGLSVFWHTPDSAPPTSDTAPRVNVLQEHYKPKLLAYFPQPITVENTEIYLGFPGAIKSATPQEHQNVVLFLNGLSQSNSNMLIERYPFSEASDIYIKVIAKDMKRTEYDFDVFGHGINTSDNEVILVEKDLIKLVYR